MHAIHAELIMTDGDRSLMSLLCAVLGEQVIDVGGSDGSKHEKNIMLERADSVISGLTSEGDEVPFKIKSIKAKSIEAHAGTVSDQVNDLP